MKEIRFVLGAGDSAGEITSKLLNARWNVGFEETPTQNINDAIADILLIQLKNSITLELVKELIEDVVEK